MRTHYHSLTATCLLEWHLIFGLFEVLQYMKPVGQLDPRKPVCTHEAVY